MSSNDNTAPEHKGDFLGARAEAAQALIRLWREGEQISEANMGKLPPSSRARAIRLVRGALRRESQFGELIASHAKTPPDMALRALLMIALYELLIEKEEPYGVINSIVEIAKRQAGRGGGRAKAGFVNAILRKLANAPLPDTAPDGFGKKLTKALGAHYSPAHIKRMNIAQAMAPPIDLRLVAGEEVAEWAERLGGEPLEAFDTIRIDAREQLSALEGYDEGKWWVQDIAAGMAVRLFGDIAAKRALDLCAAPGGKTMQLIDAGANVVAIDRSPSRMKRLEENLTRMNMKARLEIGDALSFDEKGFDAVLIDAPCSATGTIRRHPELRHTRPLARLKALLPIQAKLLDHGFALLREGGEMVYAVCSLLHEEGEAQIDAFLARNPSARLAHFGEDHPLAGYMKAGYLRSFPDCLQDKGGMDGFFCAKIIKLRA